MTPDDPQLHAQTLAALDLCRRIVDATTDLDLADALSDVELSDGPTAYLACVGLAYQVMADAPPGGQFRLLAVGGTVDEIAALSPEASGHLLAARFMTAVGNGDGESTAALFATTCVPVDAVVEDEDDDDVRTSTFLYTLATHARAAQTARVRAAAEARAQLN